MATPTYSPSPFVRQLLGQAPSRGLVPFAGGPGAERFIAEEQIRRTPNQDRLMAVSELSGGNNYLGNDAANREMTLLALQRDARNRAALLNGQSAVAEMKRQQWINGTRSLEDEMPGTALPLAYQQGYVPPMGMNEVRGGVAFQNGQPVGFAGSVPGVPNGIPEAGFNPSEQAAYRAALWDRVQQGVDANAFASGYPAPANQSFIPQIPASEMELVDAPPVDWSSVMPNGSVGSAQPSYQDLPRDYVPGIPQVVPQFVLDSQSDNQRPGYEKLWDYLGQAGDVVNQGASSALQASDAAINQYAVNPLRRFFAGDSTPTAEQASQDIAVEENTVAYTPTQNDTIESVAMDFNISEADLRKLNNLKPSDKIKKGVKLRVPIPQTVSP